MLYTSFKNYEEYREMFYRADGSRKNKILLDFLTCNELHTFYISKSYRRRFLQQTMVGLYDYCMEKISNSIPHNSLARRGQIELLGYRFESTLYYCDEQEGVCLNGDIQSYRYKRLDNHKVYKMKVGKLFAQIIEDDRWGSKLPESVKIYLCEEVTKRWKAKRLEEESRYELDYGSSLTDFRRIYDYYKDCACGFHSCMSGGSHADFYTDAVDATAAWIRDTETGDIVARCVIYDKVMTSCGNIIRLAERQYAENEQDYLKAILINKLIKEGLIDGYKAIGADCHDASNFLDINGKKFENTDFSIECRLDYGDTLSYQDSFKWYNIIKGRAYNYHEDYADISLAETDATLYDPRNYDDYHECYTENDVVSVYCYGRWISCDDQELDDFILIRGDYYHEDYVSSCPNCGDYFLTDDGCEHDVTEFVFCCVECMLDYYRDEDEE